MCFSSPKAPPMPAPVAAAPAPAPAPTTESPEVKKAGEDERGRQTRLKGRGSTLLTGGLGDTSTPDTANPTAKKVLLGG